jgi:hypothetical protein
MYSHLSIAEFCCAIYIFHCCTEDILFVIGGKLSENYIVKFHEVLKIQFVNLFIRCLNIVKPFPSSSFLQLKEHIFTMYV